MIFPWLIFPVFCYLGCLQYYKGEIVFSVWFVDLWFYGCLIYSYARVLFVLAFMFIVNIIKL